MSRAPLLAAALLTACAGPQAPPAAVSARPAAPVVSATMVRNAGFEEPVVAGRDCPPRWECTAHADAGSFRFSVAREGAAGGASVCIERVGKEPWALVTQGFHTTAARGQRMRLSVSVQAQGLSGGAGPWIQSQGGGAHAQKLVQSTRGWERVSVELAVPADSNLLEVGVVFEGAGKACFDDVRLEVL